MGTSQTVPILIVFGVLAVLQIAMIYAVFSEKGKVAFDVRRLYLGAGVLFFLGNLLVFAIAVYIWGPDASAGDPPGQVVFDTCVKIVPPILTLILGYYFGAAQAGTALSEIKAALSGPVVTSAATTDKDMALIKQYEAEYKDDPSYAPIDYSQQGGARTAWR